MLPRGLTVALTILISLVWAANVTVGFVNPDLRDPTINAIFAIVVGAIYALGRTDNTNGRTVRQRVAAVIAGDDPKPPSTPDDETGERT